MLCCIEHNRIYQQQHTHIELAPGPTEGEVCEELLALGYRTRRGKGNWLDISWKLDAAHDFSSCGTGESEDEEQEAEGEESEDL